MNNVRIDSPRLEICALGDIAEVCLGKTPRKADYRSSGYFKIIKFRDILESGQIDWDNSDKGFVSETPESLTGLRELRVGDVLVTASAHMSEHIGRKAALVKAIPSRFKGAFVVGEILQIRPKPGVDPRWVLNYVRSRDGYKAIQDKVHGVHLIASRAKEIDVPVAELEVQQRLLDEIDMQFSRLDEAVANLKRVKANLKRYKATVLKAAVEGRLVPTEAELARREEHSYETGEHLLERILERRRAQWKGRDKYKEPPAPDTSSLPELPEGWAWGSVSQLADVQLGKMLDRQKHRSGKELPYLRNINVRWGTVETSDLLTMFFRESELDRYSLRSGDVVVCEGGEPGRAAVWDGRVPGMMYQKAIHRVRFLEGYSGMLLVLVLEDLAKSGRLERWFTGSTIKHFTRESFAQLPIPVPPCDEQKRIVAEVDHRLSLVAEADAQVDINLQRAARLRESALSRAFSPQTSMR